MNILPITVALDRERHEVHIVEEQREIAIIHVPSLFIVRDILDKMLVDFHKDTGVDVPRATIVDAEDYLRGNPDDN